MSDGKGASFLDFERHAQLWMRTTKTDPASRASPLVLHMNSVPRQFRPSARGGHLGDRKGDTRILGILSNYFAPEAAGAIYEQVMRFMQYRSAEQSCVEFIVEFDLL